MAPLKLLILSNLPPKTALKVKFSCRDIDHPIYGKCNNIRGEIPFSLPTGLYTISKYFEIDEAEQNAVLEKCVERCRHLKKDLSEDEFRCKVLTVIIKSVAFCPSVDPSGQGFESYINYMTTAIVTDDELDEGGGMSNIDTSLSNLFQKYSDWELAFSGNIESISEISSSIPELELYAAALAEMLKQTKSDLPNVNIQMKYYLRQIFMMYQAFDLAYKLETSCLSEDGLKVIRGYDVGILAIVETHAMFKNIRVPKHIRDCHLFQLLTNMTMASSGLLNDILGLQKDISNSATNFNCILRRIVRDGLSFTDAFNQALERLRNVLHDLRIVSQKLIDAFPMEQELLDYVQICLEANDGQLHSFLLACQQGLRYGSMDVEVIGSD